ncbi:uncharacterized protein LTR77_004911 [Saxophila tyrrhenica]|uniref:Tyrosine specific protein phosphatases domain-containing protein n=1 Tax=Saxophila tyrrhenica TaxID=1690608 RepID=A0AAV9PAD4_9PEZI|nr:hypothetical protein LTR77_004911 [Saxophila tyrrhenica]
MPAEAARGSSKDQQLKHIGNAYSILIRRQSTLTMTNLPSPPFVDIKGIANFRDVGGQLDNVRKGVVFRSADPSKASEEGLKKMSKDLGITTIFDLRSAPEIKRDGPEWADIAVDAQDVFEPYGIKRQWVPVFAEQDYGPDQVALRYKEYTREGSAGFVKAYHDILLSAPSAYGAMFRHLAQEKPTPCLVNCTAGKDRTGVVVALLLSLIGVDKEKIAEEYALTDQGLAELRPIFIERLLKNPALEGNREGVGNMVSSKKENMLAALEMIQKEFGGAENYMQERCGLEDEEIGRLRKNLRA